MLKYNCILLFIVISSCLSKQEKNDSIKSDSLTNDSTVLYQDTQIWDSTSLMIYNSRPLLKKEIELEEFDYERNKKTINKLVKDFYSETDPIRIQKYICFPYFYVRHKCYPRSAGVSYDLGQKGLKGILTDEDIIKSKEKLKCKNPIFFIESKIRYTDYLRDSLTKYNLDEYDIFFAKEENRTEYCKWFIDAYNFPRENDIHAFDTIYSKKNDKGEIIEINLLELSVVKINNEFKISSLYYAWN